MLPRPFGGEDTAVTGAQKWRQHGELENEFEFREHVKIRDRLQQFQQPCHAVFGGLRQIWLGVLLPLPSSPYPFPCPSFLQSWLSEIPNSLFVGANKDRTVYSQFSLRFGISTQSIASPYKVNKFYSFCSPTFSPNFCPPPIIFLSAERHWTWAAC